MFRLIIYQWIYIYKYTLIPIYKLIPPYSPQCLRHEGWRATEVHSGGCPPYIGPFTAMATGGKPI